MGPILEKAFKSCRLLTTCGAIGLGVAWMLGAAAQERAALPREMPQDYRIGAGDVLQILVWREPDASVPEIVVRSDGKISLPLIGDIAAAGLTPAELQASLLQLLSHYYNSPVVSVLTKVINSRQVYVSGNVKKEGPIALTRPMTVLQALEEAGGLGEWAHKGKVYVLRKNGGKEEKLPFNYKAVIKGEHLEQNIDLLPNDTIVVP